MNNTAIKNIPDCFYTLNTHKLIVESNS